MVEFNEDKQNLRVQALRKQEEEELAQILSQKYGIPYIDLTGIPINTDALRLIPEEEARKNQMAGFNIVGKKVQVAVFAPQKQEVQESIKALEAKGFTIIPFITSTGSLEKAWGRYAEISFAAETKAGSLDISTEEIESFLNEVKSIDDVGRLIKDALALKRAYRTSRILSIIMAGSLATKASDIHIEPEEGFTRLRYRLDGVLIEALDFDKDTYNLLLSRIKLLSNLKLNIKENAQDGRFSVKIKDKDIEIRTSLLPGAYGESIVMRILDPKSISVPMEDLGMPPKLLAIIQHEIQKPNGMLLTTGPTGSGKTTSLYAFLKKIYSPEVKIITIEDPIEYHLPGIVQTQVDIKRDYTFANGLRAVLRQDPDVLMVGEIRDSDTAETAINASLTGHLVFSTLHTNDAPGAFPRLIDLGVNSKVLTSAISITMAQRLVRKICKSCIYQIELPKERLEIVKRIIASMPEDEKPKSDLKFFSGKGCEACNKIGYAGRIGIYEGVLTDANIEKVVESNPSEREIRLAARPQGIMTMTQDGIQKVLAGITSLDELERVVDLEADLYYSDDKPAEKVGIQETNL